MARLKEYKNRVGFSGNCEKELLEKIDEIRWREHKERNDILLEAISEYVKVHYEGNSTYKLDNWNDDPKFQAMPALLSNLDTWKEFILEHTSREEAIKIITQCNRIRDFVSIKWDREREKREEKK